MRSLFLLLFLLLFLPLPGSALKGDIRFERLGTENYTLKKGLSQNTVHCIFQDSRGFMWFGTWDGLNMYDGYSFSIYKPDLFNGSGDISNQTITWITEDKKGTLWVATERGLNAFDPATRTFHHYLQQKGDPSSISSDTLNFILIDSRERMWVACENGLNLFDPENGRFRRFLPEEGNPASLANGIVRWLMEDPQGHIWCATRKGISVLDPQTGLFRQLNRANMGLVCDTINSLICDRQGRVWIATDKGLHHFDPLHQTLHLIPAAENGKKGLSHPKVDVLLEDRNGIIWAGTYGGGLNRLDPVTGDILYYRHNSEQPQSLSNNYVISLFEDRSGIIWAGTNWKGVNKITPFTARFDHVFARTESENALNNNLVWSLFEDEEKKLWIATDYGINILDRKSGRFSYLRHQEGNPQSPISDKVSYIYGDRDGHIWFGTFDAGCSRYDPATQSFLHFHTTAPPPRQLPDNDVGDILQDKEGIIWIGTGSGLYRYDPVSEEAEVIRAGQAPYNALYADNITRLYQDSEGYIWIGTYHSLEKLDPKTRRVRTYLHDEKDPESISTDAVFSIYEDSKKRFWIGTMGGGLNLMDRRTGSFTYYAERDGLPNNVVYAILEDEEGNLWMSTNYGLSVFDPNKALFVNYDVRDGLQSNEFNLGAAFKNGEGEMFFGGMFGYNSFFPASIRQNTNVPRIAITAFEVFSDPLTGLFNDGDSVCLEYGDNFFTIHFSALDFTNPSRNLYRYRLLNFNKDWVLTDAQKRFAEYTRVPPGDYVFQVMGSNNDGVWNEEGLTLHILISPPWYATTFARISAVLLFIGLLYGGIALRIRRLRRHHQMEKKVLAIENEIIDIRQKALRLQMNPHFIFNSLNSIQSFMLANHTEKAIHYLSKFSRLMRSILVNSNEAWVPLNSELGAIRHYMDIEKLRFDNAFDYEILLDEEVDESFIEIPPMIIQPYIENAIIHGLVNKETPGMIYIRIRLEEKALYWEIEDNGIGREASLKLQEQYGVPRKSRGMTITGQRLQMLNQTGEMLYGTIIRDLKDEGGTGCGTLVTIRMPFRES